MGGISSLNREQPSVNRRLVWFLRVASMLFLLPSLALTVLCALDLGVPLPYWTSIVSLVLYPVVFWGLGAIPPRKIALGLAIALGSLWFVPTAIYASGFTFSLFQPATRQDSILDVILLLAGATCLLTLLHGAYVGVALKVFRSTSKGRGDVLKMVGAVVGGLVSGVWVVVAILFAYGMPPGQSPAVGSLRTINTAEITYFSTYERGYTTSLAELGLPPEGTQPSASAAGLIDSVLATGTKRYRTYNMIDDLVDEIAFALGRGIRHGYRYDYRPGPRDEHGRIRSYTICARPIGERHASYFTDESGVIRTTEEDRCPNEKDYPTAG